MADIWVDISGEFDPDDLTSRTGIIPSTVRRKGERISPGRFSRSDEWSLRFDVMTQEFESALQLAIQRLESMAHEVERLKAEHAISLTVTFEAYVVGSPSSIVPGLTIGSNALRQLAELQATLYIDISLLTPDQETIERPGPSHGER